MSIETKVKVVAPVEPHVDLTFTGVRNVTKIGDTLQLTLPLSVMREIQSQIQQALVEAGLPMIEPKEG